MKRLKGFLLGVLLLTFTLGYELKQWRREMGKDTRTAWKYFFIAVLAIAVIRLLCGCSKPMTAPIPGVRVVPFSLTVVDSFPDHPNSMAETTCDSLGFIVVTFRRDIWENPNEGAIARAHEFSHVAQVGFLNRGCKGFVQLYRSDLRFRLLTEGEAFCRGGLVGMKVYGWTWEEMIYHYSEDLFNYYHLELSREEIVKTLKTLCSEIQRENPSS